MSRRLLRAQKLLNIYRTYIMALYTPIEKTETAAQAVACKPTHAFPYVYIRKRVRERERERERDADKDKQKQTKTN